VEVKQRYFSAGVISDSLMKVLLDALVLAPPGPQLPRVVRTLTGEPLRTAVAQYFARLSPAMAGGRNKMYEEYADRLREVNRLYSERQMHQSGVHTDRGRIYMKYGAPDEKTAFELQNRRNIELWKYSRQRGMRFVFLDETGFGHLNLIMSTDPNEPSAPDWQERIGDDTVVRQILQ
jgi:GWxTD domain-containing protein